MALDFLAGCLGGCAGIVVGHPFDTVKVHIQTQDHRNPKYRGTWHCFKTLLVQDSMAGLYRGMSSPMAGVAVINSIVFGVYGQSQKLLKEGLPSAESNNHLVCCFLTGAAAGIAQTPVSSPIELAKTRLQLQKAQPGVKQQRITGPVQCLREIHRAKGFRGVFSGFGVTLLREAPSYGIYFATYEALTGSQRLLPTWQMLLAGGLAGTASWIVSYPIDVVKSRLQADTEARYSGALDCLRKSVRTEGYGCLVRGLNSTIVRAFPTNAVTFAVVTWTMRLFGEDESREMTTSHVKPLPSSWSSSDRYGDSAPHSIQPLLDSDYLQDLLRANLALVPQETAQKPNGSAEQFDEAHHFEWAREMIHY
ncbi:PREDICTED: mitochondrial basic amino acids transporter [Ceratosolen solmsi marchali]|uniref:Mitochondrial basic amino acids transporter n=1 Tax=Ceratosolen solmsi marchali TaxID=326594 RepID=A0AAJ7DXI7_9HYME|nr:PREDICTED: mitochondrial basic amino acids transporter [Ceratosolen solmsi marchali]